MVDKIWGREILTKFGEKDVPLKPVSLGKRYNSDANISGKEPPAVTSAEISTAGSPTVVAARPARLDASESLDKIVLFTLEEAQGKLAQEGELEPFTVILCGENLFIERQPGADAVACLRTAAETVQKLAHLAQAYVFSYDGYVSTPEGSRDALIAERGILGTQQANAFALLYSRDTEQAGELCVEPTIFDLGPAALLLESQPSRLLASDKV